MSARETLYEFVRTGPTAGVCYFEAMENLEGSGFGFIRSACALICLIGNGKLTATEEPQPKLKIRRGGKRTKVLTAFRVLAHA